MSPKRWRTVLVVFILLGLLGYSGYRYLSWKAANAIRDAMNKHSSEDVSFGFDKLKLHLFDGSMALYNVVLKRSHMDSVLWQVSLRNIELQGFRYTFASESSTLDIASIEASGGQIKINQKNPNFNIFDTPGGEIASEKVKLTALNIGRIDLFNSTLNYNSTRSEKGKANFEIHLSGLEFVESTEKIVWKTAEIELGQIAYQTADSVYNISAARARLNLVGQEMVFDSVKLKSNYGKKEFQELYGYRKSRFDMEFPILKISGWKIAKDSIYVDDVQLDKPLILLSRDNRLPFPERITPMPQQMLDSLGFPFKLDTLSIHQGRFNIEITGERIPEPAELYFSAVNGQISQVQNIDIDAAYLKVEADAMFMGKAPIHLDFEYLNGSYHPWQLSAKASGLDLTVLNPLLSATLGLEVGKGNMKLLDFDIFGNQAETAGRVQFLYDDLSIEMSEQMKSETPGILRFLFQSTGSLLYHKSNEAGSKERTVTIELDRNVQKDFTGQWLDALMAGMIESVVSIETGNTEKKKKTLWERIRPEK